MRKPKQLLYVLFFFMTGLFLFGIIELFGLAFESGEMYPPYSSLRTDPLGAKALHESLALLKTLEVSRNYETFSKLSSGRDTTLLFLGLAGNDLEHTPKKIVNVLDRFMQEGGRLVIAFAPDWHYLYFGREVEENGKREKQKDKEEEKKDEKEPCSGDNPDDCDREEFFSISMAEHWGLQVKIKEKYDPGEIQVAQREKKGPLPESVNWHTGFYFDKIDKPWQAVYTVDRKPVIIERPHGKGSLVLAGDSYLFSNEALHKERQPELLVWFMGPDSKIVFDEVHFGIVKQEGVAALIRRFRMQWFLIGFLLMAGLFIWKQMMPLIPPPEKEREWEKANLAVGLDYAQGLVSLLKRSIRIHAILNTCFEEWSKSMGHRHSRDKQKSTEIKDVLLKYVSKKRDPVQGYREICSILTRTGRK